MEMKAFFWVIFIIWVLFGGYVGWAIEPANRVRWIGTNILLLILVFLLGWKVFGFIVNG